MRKHPKIFITFISLAAIFLCVLIILLVITPQLINLESVKKEVKRLYAEDLGGEIEYQRLKLAFLPRPHVVISEVSFTIPAGARGTVDSLKVFPKILPLFTGKLEIGAIQSRSPEITIQFPEASKDEGKSPQPFLPEAPGELIKSVIRSIAQFNIPSIAVTVSNGRIHIFEGPQRFLGLQAVAGQIHHKDAGVEFSLQCQSNFWDNIAVKGRYTEPDFKFSSRIELKQFRPHALIEYFFPETRLKMTNARANLNLDLQANGPEDLQAAVQGAIPYMYWRRGKKNLKVNDARFQTRLQFDGQMLTLDLLQLDLKDPRLRLAGRLNINPAESRIHLFLEGRQINVATAQSVALALTENADTASDIFEILRGGDFQKITFESQAPDWAQLADENNYMIRGRLGGGKISIPDVSLHLQNVHGDATIANGVLRGENVEAQMGNSFGKQGKLSISLTEEAAPFHIEGLIQADLSQLPSVLANLIEDAKFKKELRLLEKFEGSAVGMLVVGEDSRDVDVKITASDIHLNAVYQRIPYPLIIDGGNLILDGDRIAVTNCNATIGKSSLSRLSTRLGWQKSSPLEVSSKSARIDLTQLHAWLRQQQAIERHLGKLETITGTLSLQNFNFKGPPFEPGRWRLKSTGSIQNLSLSSTLLPEALTIARGQFSFEDNRLKIENLNAHVGRSSFSNLNAGLKWGEAASVTASSGTSVVYLDEVYAWLRSHQTLKQRIPEVSALKGSLAFKNLRFEAPIGAESDQTAHLNAAIDRWTIHSPRFPTDIELSGGQLVWRGVRVGLEETNARFGASTISRLSLGRQWGRMPFFEGSAAAAGFQIGDLYPWLISFEALDRAFKGFAATQGQMTLSELAFKGPVNASGAWQFKLSGDLKDLALQSDHLKAPIVVRTAKFSANDAPDTAETNGRIDLTAVQIGWEDSQIALQGKTAFSEDEIFVDMQLTADRLNWGQVDQIVKMEQLWGADDNMVLLGGLRVESDNFSYEDYVWQPAHADISFSKSDTRVVIRKAYLCGIHFPGILKVSDDVFEFYFNPAAKDQDLEPSIACLSAKQNLADGSFYLGGELMAKARPSAFPKSLTGNLEFKADQGRIYRFGLLAKIFALLNVTEIYRGEVPELKGTGFAYNSMQATGVFEDGKLMIKDTSIDSPSMGIAIEGDIDLIKKKVNLIVLVAPFKTFDRIVKHIPLVSNILGGKLISIPFRATGDIGDPDVIPLSPTAVGSGLLGILQRTLKLPITIIQPVLPGSKDSRTETEKSNPTGSP